MLKVEEKDGLGVISLLFTIELLEDTHKQLWEKPCLGGTETAEAGSFDAIEQIFLYSYCLFMPTILLPPGPGYFLRY